MLDNAVAADVYLEEPNVTIYADQVYREYTISIISDDILEYNEEVSLVISGYDRVNGGDNATITILNDDGKKSSLPMHQ